MNTPATEGGQGRIAHYGRDDRRFAASAGFAAVAALAGLVWILTTFTKRPWVDAGYHVPIAFVVVGGSLDAFYARRDRPTRGFLLTTALAAAYTVGRVINDWPLSGHGVLGAHFAVAATRPFWRRLGAAIAVQAFVTKWWLDERPESGVYGAALGVFIGLVARRIDRARPTATTHS